jgi:alpha-L-rhamnosidase
MCIRKWMVGLVLSGLATSAQAQVLFPQNAHWIAAEADASKIAQGGKDEIPLPIFRYGFKLGKPVKRATLLVSGLGQFEAHVNGRNVTDALLTPGWSDYRKRVFYDSYDVTALVRQGDNAIGVMLGNGMYNVENTKGRYTKFTGSFGQPKLIAAVQISYSDGSKQTIVSDAGWKTSPGPIVFSSTYGGEDYDARLEQRGWDAAGFVDAAWSNVATVSGPGGVLQAETIPPVKAFERYEPVRVTHPRANVTVYDLAENMAGWPEIEVRGQRGAQVKLIAGELLDKNGFVTQRSANAFPDSPNSFTYTLRGGVVESWHPRFSYYGFRYVQVEVSGGEASVVHLDGRFLHDAVPVDGDFESSSALLNRIHRIIDRAVLSNLFSVVTDCPHREKLGWLEQTHLAGASLMYNYGLASLYAKMSDDIEDAQLANGLVPDIAPEYSVFGGPFRDSPEWGAAVVLSPWTAYQFYGNVDNLRMHYASMARYAAYLKGKAKGGLLLYGLGDWYDIGPGAPGVSKLTGSGLTATATYYELLCRMVDIATLLNKPDDAASYAAEAASTKQVFNARYFQPEKEQYDSGSQTADAMPLAVGLVPERHRDQVLASLIADIRKHDNHVTAGDVGFHYVVRALTDGDRSDVLYDMFTRTDKPSYGDQLMHRATTLTEAWDANPESSQNHFMLGHAEEWFYRGLAGIDFDMSRQGAERIRIHPSAPGDLHSAGATYESGLGKIVSRWSRRGETLELEIAVPAAATVVFPRGYAATTTATKSTKSSEVSREIVVRAGSYHFNLKKD